MIYLVSQEDKKESNPLSTSLTSSKITYSYAHNTNRVLKDKNILTLVSSIKKYNNDDIILETGYQYMANLPVATRKCIYTQGPTTYHIIFTGGFYYGRNHVSAAAQSDLCRLCQRRVPSQIAALALLLSCTGKHCKI